MDESDIASALGRLQNEMEGARLWREEVTRRLTTVERWQWLNIGGFLAIEFFLKLSK